MVTTLIAIFLPIIFFGLFGPEAVAQRRFEKAMRHGTADESEKILDDIDTIQKYSTWRAMFLGKYTP